MGPPRVVTVLMGSKACQDTMEVHQRLSRILIVGSCFFSDDSNGGECYTGNYYNLSFAPNTRIIARVCSKHTNYQNIATVLKNKIRYK